MSVFRPGLRPRGAPVRLSNVPLEPSGVSRQTVSLALIYSTLANIRQALMRSPDQLYREAEIFIPPSSGLIVLWVHLHQPIFTASSVHPFWSSLTCTA